MQAVWTCLYVLTVCQFWLATCEGVWDIGFLTDKEMTLNETETGTVYFSARRDQNDKSFGRVKILVSDDIVATVGPREFILESETSEATLWNFSINITGQFLGRTKVILQLEVNQSGRVEVTNSEPLAVIVLRKKTLTDRIFNISVIVLCSIIFINFGCALDVYLLKQAIVKPIGPAIGLLNHFCLLPLISYGMGLLLFPGEGAKEAALRLGLFFTAVSPAGGASNIWTYSLGGNLNLSITMTAVSTLASFLMIPFWTLTLGRVIFSGGSMGVPYRKIATSAIGLFVPLALGFMIQIYFKKLSNIMVRILKPFSVFLIVFIVVFAIVTNLYLFQLFTWQILLAGFGLPLIGYTIGLLLASILKQPGMDIIAISIETGIQNTGIAIFLLRFCLPEPESDLTTVAPVAVALMTPVPLFIFYLVRRLRGDLQQLTVPLLSYLQ